MTPEELLSELRARLPALDDLIAGQGDPRDLVAALLPEVPEERRRAAARAVARRPEVARLADVDGAPPDERPAALAFVAALAGLMRLADRPPLWQDLVDEVRYDLLGRPFAYRDLSPHALLLAETLDVTEETPHGSLLRLTARAALDALGPEPHLMAEHVVLRARHNARARRWKVWTGRHPQARALEPAVARLEEGRLPLAASDAAPDALARVRIGEALGGELTLAVLPAGVALEWDGDADPPDRAALGAHPLEPLADGGLAARTWLLPLPPDGPLELRLERGADKVVVRWGA